MAFPDSENAIVTEDKLCDYLLNPFHPVGGPNAAWFATIGYTRKNWTELLAAASVNIGVLPDLKSMTNTKSNMNMMLAAIAMFVFAIFLFAKSRSTPKIETLSNADAIEEMKARASSAVVDRLKFQEYPSSSTGNAL